MPLERHDTLQCSRPGCCASRKPFRRPLARHRTIRRVGSTQRHDQHRYDGRRYVVVDRLPRGCRHVYYRGQPYYYHGAHWYRPYGARFVAVAPPAGVIIDGRGVTFTAWVPLVRW
ncbi:MAG: hypothetical protein IPJ97_18570 [Proteobacteria bacterium]|nr:hypothetical protein [Pseudomonadota bacterium]